MSNVCVLSVLFCFVLFRGEGGARKSNVTLPRKASRVTIVTTVATMIDRITLSP